MLTDLFWNASLEEQKAGYMEDKDFFTCLLCGERVEKGIIYPCEGRLYEAGRFMKAHIESEHGSVFDCLIGLDRRETGLTDHQHSLLRLFYQGRSDDEVRQELGIGSSATIRNHRFVLREKERQARVFLTVMELLKAGAQKQAPQTGAGQHAGQHAGRTEAVIPPHDTARMVDDRYRVTEKESEKIIARYFENGPDGPLKTFDMKEKSKIVVLRQLIRRFETGRSYSEKEVNMILKAAYEDYVTLRRYLIEYGFMDRKTDGSSYWVRENRGEPDYSAAAELAEDDAINGAGINERKRDGNMDRKKELRDKYKEMKTQAGVYQIRNKLNNKVLVVATPNLRTMNGKPMTLNSGGHYNSRLQEEWSKYGEGAFAFEVLEVLEQKEEGFFDLKEELKGLEAKWLEKLQPYGDKGYH